MRLRQPVFPFLSGCAWLCLVVPGCAWLVLLPPTGCTWLCLAGFTPSDWLCLAVPSRARLCRLFFHAWLFFLQIFEWLCPPVPGSASRLVFLPLTDCAWLVFLVISSFSDAWLRGLIFCVFLSGCVWLGLVVLGYAGLCLALFSCWLAVHG